MATGLTIATLFAATRRAARQAQMEELRAVTQRSQSVARQISEREAQANSLERMRQITSAQLSAGLIDRGISPMMLTGGTRSNDPLTASLIAQAAAQKAGTSTWR